MSIDDCFPLVDPDAEPVLMRLTYSLHPARLVLLSVLLRGDATTGELGAQLGLTPSRVAKHLIVLRMQRVVTFHLKHRQRCYSLAGGPVAEALAVLLTSLEASLTPPAPLRRASITATARTGPNRDGKSGR